MSQFILRNVTTFVLIYKMIVWRREFSLCISRSRRFLRRYFFLCSWDWSRRSLEIWVWLILQEDKMEKDEEDGWNGKFLKSGGGTSFRHSSLSVLLLVRFSSLALTCCLCSCSLMLRKPPSSCQRNNYNCRVFFLSQHRKSLHFSFCFPTYQDFYWVKSLLCGTAVMPLRGFRIYSKYCIDVAIFSSGRE